jgi:hypothetical protein
LGFNLQSLLLIERWVHLQTWQGIDREVSLWYEPWLKEGTVGSSIDYVNVLDTNLHVKDLWHNGTWNFTAIPAWLKERILAVPVPSLGYTADCVIWVAKLLEHTQSNRHIYG